jgi:hypothetical protein
MTKKKKESSTLTCSFKSCKYLSCFILHICQNFVVVVNQVPEKAWKTIIRDPIKQDCSILQKKKEEENQS